MESPVHLVRPLQLSLLPPHLQQPIAKQQTHNRCKQFRLEINIHPPPRTHINPLKTIIHHSKSRTVDTLRQRSSRIVSEFCAFDCFDRKE